MSNVTKFPGVSSLDFSPEVIFQEAMKKSLSSVVIIGYTPEGEEYFASSIADGGTVLWLMERSKLKLLQQGDE